MCYRRARAERAKQVGTPGRAALAGLGAVLATATAAASLAGCSEAGSSQAPEMSAVAAQRQQKASGVDPGQLGTALLSRADMGSNFSELPTPARTAAAPDPGATSVTGCPQLGILAEVGVTGAGDDQGVTYQSVGGMPVVGESLRAGPTAGIAAEYAEDRAALATCAGVNVTADGTEFTLQLTPVTLNEKSATAVRLDGMLRGVQVTGYLALDDVGPAELGYVFLQVDYGSPQLATYYFGKADHKARHYLDEVWSS